MNRWRDRMDTAVGGLFGGIGLALGVLLIVAVLLGIGRMIEIAGGWG